MSQDRVKAAYEAFRGGFRDGGGMPSWEKTSTIIRDLTTVAYLQGTLDGPISLLREGSGTMGPNERTQWKKRVLTLLAAIDGPCCKGLAPNAECRCYQEEQKTMPRNTNDLASGPFFLTQWEREDYEREQRGEKPMGPALGMIVSAGFGAGLPACAACGKQPRDDCTNPVCAFREPRTGAGSLD